MCQSSLSALEKAVSKVSVTFFSLFIKLQQFYPFGGFCIEDKEFWRFNENFPEGKNV